MDTCPTCGRIDGATRPHLLLDSEELCPSGAPGDYPPEDPADLEGREEWGTPEEWATEPQGGDPAEEREAAGCVAVAGDRKSPSSVAVVGEGEGPALPTVSAAPKAKRVRKAKAGAEPTTEDLLTQVAKNVLPTGPMWVPFPMPCPVESCRSEVSATFDGERLVLAEHNHPRHLGRCPCVVVPRKHWPPELTRAAFERAGEWMVGEASDPGLGVSISTPEPAPVVGTGDVWAEIIDLEPEPALREVFAARRQVTPLQRNNGRDHENDLAQELCDGIVYARAAERPATHEILRDILFHGEAYAEEASNFGAALRGIHSALGVSDLTAAHQRIDALRQAEKGLEQILTAAGEGSTAVGVARDVAQFKGRFTDAGDRISRQGETIRRLQEIVSETERRVIVPEGWTALDEDGCDLADYRAQILAIEDCLNTVDPDNRARSEDDTTAGQVIAILRRMVDGSEDLAAALQPTDAGVRATLVELGGNPPRAVFVADVSRKTAQRLGRSPGLYGKVTVLLPGDR